MVLVPLTNIPNDVCKESDVKWKFQKINVPNLRKEFYDIMKKINQGVTDLSEHTNFQKNYPTIFEMICNKESCTETLFNHQLDLVENAQRVGKNDMFEETRRYGDQVNRKFLPQFM